MRDGYHIIDSDTHVGPNAETLKIYASPELLRRWDELTPYYQAVTEGHHLSINPYPFKRPLRTGRIEQEATKGGKIPLRSAIAHNWEVHPTAEVNNLNAAGRLEDMDREGCDVHLIIPATFANAATVLDNAMALELYGAYHRYLQDYCSVSPGRLKGSILAAGVDPEWSAARIRELAKEPWVAAVIPVLPEGMPIDDPALNPIWEAMNEADLPILHHSFFYEPPYFPGYRDIWGNLAIARAASHPWGAQRLLAYALLSGMFDEYPNLRIGFAECSSGWVAGWLNRLDYQQAYLSRTLPETKLTPTEYARSGRVFCGVELDEGEEITQSVIDVVGDGVLMYSSDYPHGGCKYPTSPDVVLGWKGLGEETMRKLMSGNAANYLRM
ncbi:MAG: amidohydrolase [Actinomycetia bacterium]|nr:amidohydrolase [Actinomycetes bacterium]